MLVAPVIGPTLGSRRPAGPDVEESKGVKTELTDPSNTRFDTELASLTELADQVISRANAQARTGSSDRVLVAIAGPPGSGKSTTADELVDLLNKRTPGSAAVLPMDGYHYDDLVLEQRGHIARKGSPHTFDVAGFAHMLGRLRVNDEAEVAVPVFDRSIEIARAGARIIPQSVTYLVVEGNYLLLDVVPWNDLARFFDLTVFIDVPEDEARMMTYENADNLFKWETPDPTEDLDTLIDYDAKNAHFTM